jgi:hypothetical protein
MYNIPLVKVFDGAAGLDHEAPDLGHGEVSPLLDSVGKGAILTELEDNVGAFDERKSAVELDNVRMRQF